MRTVTDPTTVHPDSVTLEFDSVADLMAATDASPEVSKRRRETIRYGGYQMDWHGVRSLQEIRDLARYGARDMAADTMGIARDALRLVEETVTLPRQEMIMDVSGGAVDVGAFMSGEPECMIQMIMEDDPQVSRVVYVSASIVVSCGVDTDVMIERGRHVAALAYALTMAGYTTVLFVEYTCGTARRAARIRVQVKGANDTLDMAKIMFAFAHPGMARGLMLDAMHLFDPTGPRRVGGPIIGHGLGPIREAIRDLPPGCVYTPPLRTVTRGIGADRFVLDSLRKLGILATADA